MESELKSVDLRERYTAQLDSHDMVTREVARRQLQHIDRIDQKVNRREYATQRPWGHTLEHLFTDAGNVIQRRDARLRCGHEPFHSSQSGTCVVIDPTAGYWYCSSCRRSGDALALVMALHDLKFSAAEAWLIEQYGTPKSTDAPRSLYSPQLSTGTEMSR